jgi:TonB family protein
MARPRHRHKEKQLNWNPLCRHARPRWFGPVTYIFVLAIIVLCTHDPVSAQTSSRKLKTRIEPVYPELAKRNNISGSARVELLIMPDGKVKDVKVLGGNPVLVQAVVAAVVKWKYEPAAEESSVVVKFDFASP